MSTVQNQVSPTSSPAPRRSWFARHKILTGFGVLLIVIFVAGYIWGWPLAKWRFHRLFADSLAEIQKSPAVVERLGAPISVPILPLPSGKEYSDGNQGNAQFYFTVVGPKDKADAVALLRMLDGKWGFTQLKLTFSNHTELDLTAALEKRDGDSIPKFDPTAKQPDVKPPNLPVDIALPDLSDMPRK